MGRRLKIQRRGKGGPVYRATINAKFDINYKNTKELIRGQIIDMITDPIRSAPVAEVLMADGTKEYVICAEGLTTGQKLEFGKGAEKKTGNVLPLGDIEPGTTIFNIEKNYGDGGKFVRASGQTAILVNKKDKATIKLPSGQLKQLPLDARATIGVIAAGGKSTKPFVTAGAKFKAMKAKGKKYPRVRGVAMNPVDHPFGGSQHHVGHSKSTSRHAPAGRMVGAIASKRTGRKKK
ncbi:MAG TPA: 50S ribosomal protein L2 [archaeon]|jgi:large subunit ribosomal protein L2|nr:50S ribosomal protein L2 [archaeon]